VSVGVSVIIPTVGRELLARQLSALGAQNYGGWWEVILADNRPRGAPLAVTASDGIPSLRVVVANGKPGPSHARNAGAAAARGDLLLFCDDDDEVAPGWITAMVAALSGAGFVVGRLDDRSLNTAVTGSWVPSGAADRHMGNLGFLPIAPSCNMGIKRVLFEQIGGFDESFPAAAGEDVDLSWRVQLAGTPLVEAPDAVVRVQLRDDLRGVFRQGVVYGTSDAHLIALFKSQGCRRPAFVKVVKTWAWVPLTAPKAAVSPSFRGRWLRQTGYRIGRLCGSIRHRVFAP
jgi:glycosyltransferase involved in cell wall biosynthesis